jgi:hypothetical protein
MGRIYIHLVNSGVPLRLIHSPPRTPLPARESRFPPWQPVSAGCIGSSRDVRSNSEPQPYLASMEVQLRHILAEHLAEHTRKVNQQLINTDPEARAKYACSHLELSLAKSAYNRLALIKFVLEAADKIDLIFQHHMVNVQEFDLAKFVKVSFSTHEPELLKLLAYGVVIESRLHQEFQSMPRAHEKSEGGGAA